MLCRALLTAIAISCTFTRETMVHANDQSTQRALKDLICVLVLSGIQKEDLDVSLLTKLRQHNVNIDDLQSQKLREECINQASMENKTREEENAESDTEKKSTMGVLMTSKDSEAKPKEIQRTSETNTLNDVLKYFRDKEKTQEENLKSSKKTVIKDTNEFDKINDKDTINKISNILRRDTSEKPVTEKSQPNMENFIKFWETYMKVKALNKEYDPVQSTKTVPDADLELGKKPTVQVTQPTVSYDISNIKSSDKREYSNSIEVEHMSKMLADYIARKKIIPTETHSKVIQNLKLNSVSRKINTYLANSRRDKQGNPYFVTNNNANEISVLENNNTNYSKINKPMNLQNVYESYNEPEKINMKQNFVNAPERNKDNKRASNYEVKKGISYIMVPESTSANRPKSIYIQQNEFDNVSLKKLKPFVEYFPKQDDYSTKSHDHNNMNQNKHVTSIPPEILRRIAESVKEIVLKDLRKEMNTTTTTTSTPKTITSQTTTTISTTTTAATTTTPTTTTTTTTTPATTTLRTTITSTPATTTGKAKLTTTTDVTTPAKVDINKVQEATLEIAKFIQLFVQMKTMREHTLITPDSKMKVTETIHTHGYSLPIQAVYPRPRLPAINPYGKQNHSMQIPNNLFPHELLCSNLPITIQIPNTIQSCDQLSANFKMPQKPIMIQTNQNQIPPLGIRLSQPEIINQNIILTTQLPFLKTKHDHDRWDFMLRYGKNPDKIGDIIEMQKRLSAYSKTPSYTPPVLAHSRVRQRNDLRNLPLKKLYRNSAYHNDKNNQKARTKGYNVKKSLFVDLSPRFDNHEVIYSSSKQKDSLSTKFANTENNFESFRTKVNINPAFEQLIKEFGGIKELENVISRYKNTNVGMHNSNEREDVDRSSRMKYTMNEFESPNRIDSHFRDDPILKNGHSHGNQIFKTKSREEFKTIDDNIKSNKDFTHYKSPELLDYEKERFRNSNIRGFHERLENAKDWSGPNLSQTINDSPEVSVRVTPREQESIHRLNTRTRQDDSTFNNFLKIQEKVNNMLERILATKTKKEPTRQVRVEAL